MLPLPRRDFRLISRSMTTLTTLPAVDTPSLTLREIERHDARAFSAFMLQPGYQRYITLKMRNESEIAGFVARAVAKQGDERRNVFHLAAEERMSGEVVGDGFLILHPGRHVEIGWGVHPGMWAMGLGSEIGQALLSHAFERMQAERVWCKVMTPNAASGALARRIGMRHEKKLVVTPRGDSNVKTIDIYAMAADAYFDLAY
jgi:[ribosomal protein S5]-alanine N-acetyltransferase